MGSVTSINTAKPKVKTQRALSQREFAQALRKIKPHLPAAIQTASAIMGCTLAKDADKLKACAILLDFYVKFVNNTYKDDENGALVDDNAPNIIVDLSGRSLENQG